MVRKAWPRLASVGAAGMARSGRNGQAGRAWQDRHSRHGFGRHGQASPGRQGVATVEDQARLARCGRARARHGWQGLLGTSTRGMAGEVMRAWLGLVWQGAAGMARCGRQARQARQARRRWAWKARPSKAGVVATAGSGMDWQARRGEIRSDRGTARDGRHGWLGEIWRYLGWRGETRQAWHGLDG